MNKLLILGHHSINLERVEHTLHTNGMGMLAPSRREGLNGQEIHRIFNQIQQIPSVLEAKIPEDLSQVKMEPMWQGLALDLMLGNVESPIWGWSDTEGIRYLQFWSELDSKFGFVLVYDEPVSVFVHHIKTNSAQSISDALDNWHAYNAAIVQFYVENKNRCILVHQKQVLEHESQYVGYVKQKLKTPLLEPAHESISSLMNTQNTAVETRASEELCQTVGESFAQLAKSQSSDKYGLGEPISLMLEDDTTVFESPLTQYIISEHLKQHPHYLALYQELQALSDLMYQEQFGLSHDMSAATWEVLRQQYYAWQQYIQKYEYKQQELTKQQEMLLSEKHTLHTQLTQTKEENQLMLNQLHQVQEALEKSVQETAKEKSITESEQESSRENEMLLKQLHQVQEELERYYHENQKLKENQNPTKPVLYGAAELIKSQLDYQVGAQMIAQSKTIGGLITLPLAASRVKKRLKKQGIKLEGIDEEQLKQYRDYQKAVQTQEHLSNRLGQTYMRNARNPIGWVKMPFALYKEVRTYRKHRK